MFKWFILQRLRQVWRLWRSGVEVGSSGWTENRAGSYGEGRSRQVGWKLWWPMAEGSHTGVENNLAVRCWETGVDMLCPDCIDEGQLSRSAR